MNSAPDYSLRRMTAEDLGTVLAWRNSAEVRQFMFTKNEIGMDEHARWFGNASHDPNRHLLILLQATAPCGFINIHEISPGIAEWGFYAAPESPKGTGTQLGIATLQFVFKDRKLHKLCGQVLGFNKRSLNLHHRLGFKQEGVLREHHFDGSEYHDVICFGVLAHEWHTRMQNEVKNG